LAAFIAMLGKQWLNRYLRHAGGSVIERSGDRQRKCDGLQKWPFHLFVESLPVMLQVALLLLACGLCRYMESVNTTVAYILFTLTGLGVLFYVGIVIAGASSQDCPFQTPASDPLRSLWKKVWPSFTPVVFPIITTLRAVGEIFAFRMFHIPIHLPHFDIPLNNLSERIQLGILRVGLYLPSTGLNIRHSSHHPPLPTTQESPRPTTSKETIPWIEPGELVKVEMQNTNDARCVSWIVNNITDPDALDAAIRCASTIQWFDDGINVEPPYDLIISVFHTCFGPDGKVYPGLRDRAYYSMRAIIWIYTLASCKSLTFPFPSSQYNATGFYDLQHLLAFNRTSFPWFRFTSLSLLSPDFTPSHIQWVSNVLLHLSWIQPVSDGSRINNYRESIDHINIPLDVSLNHLLVYCNLFGSPVEEELLKVQDKS
jgi:hypothetical protein